MHQLINPPVRCAIIGAGLAGLSCATTLQQAGMAVTVFEKSRGASGRMSTRRTDDWQCDQGAQYFTARDLDFRAELARWQDAGAAALWTPRLHVIGNESSHQPDSTLERFVGTPGMTAPGHLLAAALDVRCQHTLVALHRDETGWQLQTAEHGSIAERFDCVLLAVPAPQVVPLLRVCAPELAQIAHAAPMQPSWALMLRFAAPLALPFDAAFVNRGPLRWVARNSSKPGRNAQEIWLLHATGAWSLAHVDQSADDVARDLLEAFAELGAPTPVAWRAHCWRYAQAATALNQACAWDGHAGLGLCGDWLHGGKVEGAWLSGRQLARHCLASFVSSP